jgi:probable addiction module antidote protein
MSELKPLDISKYLTEPETVSEFLTASLEEQDPDVFLKALAEVAKAHGMSQLARDSGMGRESLYKALAPGAKPRYDTILRLLSALGVKVTINKQ